MQDGVQEAVDTFFMYHPFMYEGDTLTKWFRLAPLQQSALKKMGIVYVRDLLYHFPSRYDQSGNESTIAGLTSGSEVTIFGTISNLDTRKSWKRRIPVGEARITDASGSIKVMWFHQPYIAKKFHEGTFVKAIGTVGGKDGKVYLANPHVEIADPAEVPLFVIPHETKTDRMLFAVYPESRGVTSLWFRHAIEKVMKSGIVESLEDPIPLDVRERYHLPDVRTALISIHKPDKLAHAEAARKRFSFEEMFAIQISRALDRAENDAEKAFQIHDSAQQVARFISSVDFPPTKAQTRAISDILSDFNPQARGPHPMARLLEGDVGSGKTLVAAATAYAIVTSRPPNRESGTLQVAYMAPTEILAEQHFQSFVSYFRHLPISIGLMTGSGCKKFPSKVSPGGATTISRSQLLKWIASGEIAMLVGTHALIQKSVQFQHLAYAIIDEQHRFGTKQRRALAQKGTENVPARSTFFASEDKAPITLKQNHQTRGAPQLAKNMLRAGEYKQPHFLSMTATPIPRTLALTIYGDLDISVLDELPPGRAKITTTILSAKDRNRAYEAIRAELSKRHQAYIICPRIEEPDPENQNAMQAKSVKAEAKRLKKEVFPDFAIGLLHGAMTPAEKDAVMKEFSNGAIDILVATSVVEVGVNVPNATIIIIEGAERFGLAQLHQLRGRVMRSSAPPQCFLLPESRSEISLKRLRTLEKSDDGFKLAEADLEARGAGTLGGGAQWGVSDLGMEALKNPRLIKAARDEAQQLVAKATSHGTPLPAALLARAQKISGELHAE